MNTEYKKLIGIPDKHSLIITGTRWEQLHGQDTDIHECEERDDKDQIEAKYNICMQKILGRDIDFLIHDSIIYEGVDERQIAHAIEQAAVKAKLYDFQYIMTINSDMVPYNDFNEGFNFDEYIKLRLSDEDESGSLLGILF